eukprot:TRINITY_DN5675_c2_g1_i1.p1 TRINITY_DN5675_c2_g1~~TRINITY_DN5675_c2_g1_i1.p1  ORF type:complete len:432 (+),score=81.19 TRINITY_DN5675_c2_g1_i1:116-1411(+)
MAMPAAAVDPDLDGLVDDVEPTPSLSMKSELKPVRMDSLETSAYRVYRLPRNRFITVPKAYEVESYLIHPHSSGCVIVALRRDVNKRVIVKSLEIPERSATGDRSDRLQILRVFREIAVLRFLRDVQVRHPRSAARYLVSFFECLPLVATDPQVVSVVTSVSQSDLLQYIHATRVVPYNAARRILYQITAALSLLHSRGLIHLDLKPANVLVDLADNGTPNIRVADFGLSRPVAARHETEYLCTRWYRAPELLFQSPFYDGRADMWSLGCIAAELAFQEPLLRGENHLSQLALTLELTAPRFDEIEALRPPPAALDFVRQQWPTLTPQSVEELLPSNLPSRYVDFIQQLLVFTPSRRPSAEQMMRHPLFEDLFVESDLPPTGPAFATDDATATFEQVLDLILDQVCIDHPDSATEAAKVRARLCGTGGVKK